MANPSFRIKGYTADVDILGKQREVQYDPHEQGLWITCSYEDSHDIVNKLINDVSPVTNVIAALRELEPEQQDEVLTQIVNAVTGNRKPTRAAGRKPSGLELSEEDAERAAIMEIEGGVTREEAEAAVLASKTPNNQDLNVTATGEPIVHTSNNGNTGLRDSDTSRPGLDPAIARAAYAEQEAERAAAAAFEREETERKAEWERHQTRQDARGALSAESGQDDAATAREAIHTAARAATEAHPPTQAKLAYEPEAGQRIRQAPHAGQTVDSSAAATSAGSPAVYEVGQRRQPSPLDEFMADPPASGGGESLPRTQTVDNPAPSDELPHELVKANTLRPVFEYLYAQGHTTVKGLAEAAFNLKDRVPFVARVNGLEGRAEQWLSRMKEITAE